jgi:hypothetical protein
MKGVVKMNEDEILGVIRNQSIMNVRINELTEDELTDIINHEKSNAKRLTILQRLYGRFSKLRREREHKLLFSVCLE